MVHNGKEYDWPVLPQIPGEFTVYDGFYCAHLAAENGRLGMLALLYDMEVVYPLQGHADVSYSPSAIARDACRTGHLDILTLMLDRGGVTIDDASLGPAAAAAGQLAVVTHLLDMGYNVEAKRSTVF